MRTRSLRLAILALFSVSYIWIGAIVVALTLVVKDGARHRRANLLQTEDITIEFPYSQILMIDNETTSLLIIAESVFPHLGTD